MQELDSQKGEGAYFQGDMIISFKQYIFRFVHIIYPNISQKFKPMLTITLVFLASSGSYT